MVFLARAKQWVFVMLCAWFTCICLPSQAQNIDAEPVLQAFAQSTNLIPNTTTLAGKQIQTLTDLQHLATSVGLVTHIEEIGFAEVQRQSGPVVLHLRAPEQFMVLESVGEKYSSDAQNVISNADLVSRYMGEALILGANAQEKTALLVENPVRVLEISEAGAEVSQNIRLQNRSSRTIKVEVAGTSCGCTSARLSAEQLKPGDQSILTVKMQTDGWGKKTETATLKTDDPLLSKIVVVLQARMPPSIGFSDSPVTIPSQQGREESRVVTVFMPIGASITAVKSDQSYVTTKMLSQLFAQGGVAQQVQVTVASTAPVGDFKAKLNFELQGFGVPRVTLPVTGLVASDVYCEPKQLFLGAVPLNDKIRRTFVVQSRSKQVFSIQAAESDNPLVKVKAAEVKADAHAVEVEVSTQGQAGSVLKGDVKLTLSDGSQVSIPVYAMLSSVTSQPIALPSIGEFAPDFNIVDMNGETRKLADLKGKKNLLLTFFPKCFTGGCANHLSSLRDVYSTLCNNDIEVWAVSVDSTEGEKGQKAFAKMWNLPFPLLSDTDRKLSLLYGAVQLPTDLDRRMTMLIDKNGVVRWIDTDVHVQTHGADVLQKMRELGLVK